jgi:hypothetical protein
MYNQGLRICNTQTTQLSINLILPEGAAKAEASSWTLNAAGIAGGLSPGVLGIHTSVV